MAAGREGESAADNHGEIEEAVHAGPGFQSAATLLCSQGCADLDATRERGFLSPRFRSAAAMAGWDEEALLAASLVVEDTPVREFKGKKRADARLKSPPTTNSRRKRRSRRQTTPPIPPVTLSLDEEETIEEGIHVTVEEKRDTEAACTTAENGKDRGGGSNLAEKAPVVAEKGKDRGAGSDPAEKAQVVAAAAIPCLDRLREELSCAICLDICFEPSTTPCGHSFCKKCLKCAATKCGRRCPKCRELISNARACTVNTVLWNTIQLLFPVEVEARRKVPPPEETTRDREPRLRSPRTDGSDNVNGSSSGRNNNNNNNNNARTRISGMRSAARGMARLMESDREMMRRVAAPSQSEDAALALRLQREEFLGAFRETQQPQTQQPQRSTVYLARASLRAMATRAIQQHNRRR